MKTKTPTPHRPEPLPYRIKHMLESGRKLIDFGPYDSFEDARKGGRYLQAHGYVKGGEVLIIESLDGVEVGMITWEGIEQ